MYGCNVPCLLADETDIVSPVNNEIDISPTEDNEIHMPSEMGIDGNILLLINFLLRSPFR